MSDAAENTQPGSSLAPKLPVKDVTGVPAQGALPGTAANAAGTEAETQDQPPAPGTTWSCQMDLEVDGLPPAGEAGDLLGSGAVPLETMTAGRKFLLRCQGEPAFFERDKLKLEMAETPQTTFQLLEVRRVDEKSVDLVMTSYQAGDHAIKDAILSDGKIQVALEEITMSVGTVVPPPTDGEPPKPFGPFGPLMIAWPWYYWAILAAIILTVIFAGLRKVWQRVRWKRLMEELATHSTAIQPYNQFNKDLRQIHRQYDFASEETQDKPVVVEQFSKINQAFRLYLVRELMVPALTWSDSDLLKVIQKHHRWIYDHCEKELRVTLRELRNASKAGDKLTLLDCQQLIKLCQKTTTHIWQQVKKRPSKDYSLGGLTAGKGSVRS